MSGRPASFFSAPVRPGTVAVNLQAAATMQTYHIMRVVLSGTASDCRVEQFSTVIRVSSCELYASAHLEEARFRAGVRGLGSPWRVDAEYEIARTHHGASLSHDTRGASDMGSVGTTALQREVGTAESAWAA